MSYTIKEDSVNVWARDVEDTTDLSLTTDANFVYLNSGRTLEEEINGVINSGVLTYNPMIEGCIKDLPNDVFDTEYDSVKLYGKSLINLIDYDKLLTSNPMAMYGYINGQLKHLSLGIDSTSWNEVKSVAKKMEANEEYFLIIKNTCNSDLTFEYVLDNGSGVFDGNAGRSFVVEKFKVYKEKITCLTEDLFKMKFYLNSDLPMDSEVRKNLTMQVMLLKYEDGMENWNIPFFDGIKSVQLSSQNKDYKQSVFTTVGKNLFDKDNLEQGSLDEEVGLPFDILKNNDNVNNRVRSKQLIPIKSNNVYNLSISNNDSINCIIKQFDKEQNYVSAINNQTNNFTFTTDLETNYISLEFVDKNNNKVSIVNIGLSKIQLEKGNSKTIYEKYKSNSVYLSEEVILSSLNKQQDGSVIRDEFDLKTGVYTKRIAQYELNHTLDWRTGQWETQNNTIGFEIFIDNFIPEERVHDAICDRFKVMKGVFYDDVEQIEVISANVSEGNKTTIRIRIDRSRLETEDVEGFKQWLQKYPIHIQYELNNPIIKKINTTQTNPIVKVGTTLPNGVSDTFNIVTGEYIQHVGKVSLDGSEEWFFVENRNNIIIAYTTATQNYAKRFSDKSLGGEVVTNQFLWSPQDVGQAKGLNIEGCYIAYDGNLCLSINKSRLNTYDLEGVKKYLRENQLTVYYELHTPKVIKKYGLPETYGIKLDNGVTDEYNINNNIYIQKIGKIVLDGSIEELVIYGSTTDGHIRYALSGVNDYKRGYRNNLHCETKPTWNEAINTLDFMFGETYGRDTHANDIWFVFSDSELPSGNSEIERLRAYLTQNPMVIYYELQDYKTIEVPLLNIGKTLPLGMCNTYNPITKQYVKRVASVTLDGTDTMFASGVNTTSTYFDAFGYQVLDAKYRRTDEEYESCGNLVCDEFNVNQFAPNNEHIAILNDEGKYKLSIGINGTRLNSVTIEGFRDWLRLHPLTIYYELKEYEYDVIDYDLTTLYNSFPMAYKNGIIVLDTLYSKDTLLPEVEYELTISRKSLIDKASEQILKQDKQIATLENLLIQNIIKQSTANILMALEMGEEI